MTAPPPPTQNLGPDNAGPQNSGPQNSGSEPQPKKQNVLGLVAFIVLMIAMGAAVIGINAQATILLFIVARVIAVAGIVTKNSSRTLPVTVLIIAVMYPLAMLWSAVWNLEFVSTDKSYEDYPRPTPQSEIPEAEKAPLHIGEAFSTEDWSYTINSVDFDPTEEILAADPSNTPPEEGWKYIMVNITVKQALDSHDFSSAPGSITYIEPDGVVINPNSPPQKLPNAFDGAPYFEPGESRTGNILFMVSADDPAQGQLAVVAERFGARRLINLSEETLS